MASETEIQTMIATGYLALADLLAAVPRPDWDTPSLCEDWRVREVIAHVTMPARYDEKAFMAELAARNFDFAKLSNELAARDSSLPTGELVANLRSETLHRWAPPEGGVHGALNHAVIHGLDVTVPLGAAPAATDEAIEVVLDDLSHGGIHKHFGTVVSGRRLEATDLEWSYGNGRTIRATGSDLALLLCGRHVPPERYEGDPV
jgi:uncharacterized protein (TIGR03083 family)